MVDDDDGDGDGFPSPEPRTDSRSALPRGFRAWRQLRIIKRDESFSLIFSPRTRVYGVGVEVGGVSGGPRGRGAPRGQARPPPSWTGVLGFVVISKNKRKGLIAFYDTESPPSPKTSREG